MIKLLKESYGDLSDYLERHLDSWYGRLNEIGEDIEELGLDVDEINDEYIVVHATEPDGEDAYCKIRLGGTERTISLEKFEMLESVRRSKNVLREYNDDYSQNLEYDLYNYVDYPVSRLVHRLEKDGFHETDVHDYEDGSRDCVWTDDKTATIKIYLDDRWHIRNVVVTSIVKESIRERRKNGKVLRESDDKITARSLKAISEFYSYDNRRIMDILDKIEQTNDQRKIDKAYDFINRSCDNIDDCMETGFYDLSDASWGYETDYIIEELTNILNESIK